MRILLGEFKQESNSFNPILTSLEAFERADIVRGDRLLCGAAGERAALGGMLDAIQECGDEAVPCVSMRAGSGGPVEQRVVDAFLDETLRLIGEQAPLDGVFLSLHGATLTERSQDACGDILEAVRDCVGCRTVIAVSLDLHANVTEKIVRCADYIAGFQTYPHLDLRQTGYRVAKTALAQMHGQRRVLAYAALPVMASASDYATNEGALKDLMSYAHGLVTDGRLYDFSVFLVQPWLDVAEIRSAVVTVAADDATALKYANELAARAFSLRGALKRQHDAVDDVIQKGLQNRTGKPVVLVDSADSPNAGATCDSAEVLRRLLPHQDRLSAAFPINDRPAVEQAFAKGVGAELTVSLGATLAPALSSPVTVTAHVQSLHEGSFVLEGPAARGSVCVMDKTAVLRAGKLRILITEHASRIGDPQFYRGFGIEPSLCDLVVIKACTSFRAPYTPIASAIYNADTMGAACAELTRLPYLNLPMPMYPFADVTEADIMPAKIARRMQNPGEDPGTDA